MRDTWTTRELPVLEALVAALDDPNRHGVGLDDLVPLTGLDEDSVRRALAKLDSARPPYFDGPRAEGGSYPIAITEVTERALAATGQWPTAEGAVDDLVAALTAAADQEPEPERQGKLRGAAAVLAGMGREVVVGWASGAIPTP